MKRFAALVTLIVVSCLATPSSEPQPVEVRVWPPRQVAPVTAGTLSGAPLGRDSVSRDGDRDPFVAATRRLGDGRETAAARLGATRSTETVTGSGTAEGSLPDGAPLPVVTQWPAATVGSVPEGTSSVKVRRLATDAVAEPAPTPGDASLVTRSGTWAWADPSHGRSYLATPEKRGTRMRVCGPLACLTLTTNDVGPVLRLQRAGRIGDVSADTFQVICGELRFGQCPGTYTVLYRPLGLPATDAVQ